MFTTTPYFIYYKWRVRALHANVLFVVRYNLPSYFSFGIITINIAYIVKPGLPISAERHVAERFMMQIELTG